MNNNMNEKNNKGTNSAPSTNNPEMFTNNLNQPTNQAFTNNNTNQSVNAPYNQTFIKNNKNNNRIKKIIIILAIEVSIIIILILVNLLLKFPNNNSNENNQQNQINNNKEENVDESQKKSNDSIEEENIDESQKQSNDSKNEDINDNEEQNNIDDSYLPNTNIIKRTLGQTSTFDNGISIKLTDSIEYADSKDIYYNPMFIKIEITNNSNKNFYQSVFSQLYSDYTENPIEFISDDYYYTSFEIIPMYLLGGEVKTEKSGCTLRKSAYVDSGKFNDQGEFYDINYFVVTPGEQKTAYMLCYFREEIEGAKIKNIYLLKDSNEFMYFLD